MINLILPSVQVETLNRLPDRLPEATIARLKWTTLRDLATDPVVDGTRIVFCGLELATKVGRTFAATVAEELEVAGVRVLNHPKRIHGRYELLRELHDRGINLFNAYRPDELPTHIRYPVFVRHEREHTAGLTDLLFDEASLDEAFGILADSGYADLDELLVVEYCDATDERGLHRKYSAFLVDGGIVPRYADFSGHWVVKRWPKDIKLTPDLEKEMADHELTYVRENPHADALLEIFAIAGVEYGRIDYGICEGRVCIWEINTAPHFGRGRRKRARIYDGLHEKRRPSIHAFYDLFARRLNSLADGPPISHRLSTDPEVRRRVVQEEDQALRLLERRHRIKNLMGWLRKVAPKQRLARLRRTIGQFLRRQIARNRK